MKTKLLLATLNVLPALVLRSKSPAIVYFEEANRCVDQAQNAADLMDTASSDSARSALRYAANERLDAAIVANALARHALHAFQQRIQEDLRTTAAEVTAILKDELAQCFHAKHKASGETILNITSPKVTGEILLDLAKLEAIATDQDSTDALSVILGVVTAAAARAA